MKKILSFFIMFLILASCFFTASAETLTVDDKINYLISQGIPEEFLEGKDVSAINEIYNMFFGENVQFLGTETVKMSETFSTLGVSPQAIPESDMLLKISQFQTVSFDVNNRQVIKSVMIYIEYEWFDGKPMICGKDGISVNWESELFIFKPDSFRSKDYKKFYYTDGYNYITSDWIESDSQVNPTELNQGGLGYVAYLNRGNPPYLAKDIIYYYVKGWASMSLLPKYKIYAEDGRYTVTNVQYVHSKNLFNTVGFSWNGASVTVNISGLKDSVAKAVKLKYST